MIELYNNKTGEVQLASSNTGHQTEPNKYLQPSVDSEDSMKIATLRRTILSLKTEIEVVSQIFAWEASWMLYALYVLKNGILYAAGERWASLAS